MKLPRYMEAKMYKEGNRILYKINIKWYAWPLIAIKHYKPIGIKAKILWPIYILIAWIRILTRNNRRITHATSIIKVK